MAANLITFIDVVSRVIISIASGLLVYWAFRVKTLLHGDADEIERELDRDFWLGRKLWIALQSMFDGTTTQLYS